MANFDVSYFIRLRDQFSGQANKAARAATGLKSKLSNMSRKAREAGGALKYASIQAKNFGSKMMGVGGSLFARVTLPLSILGGVALKQAADLETLGVAFESMLGSASKAKDLMKDLTNFTATTPFQLAGVGKAAKQLLAFKVSQKDMIPTLRMLGDLSAGANVPLSDMAQIFGKAKAKGKLMTEELLQLAERGIPIIDILAEGLNISKQQVFKLASESKISFGIMQKALVKMTSSGGVFFKQTEKQSKTLAGRFSTLKDNLGLTAAAIGEVIEKTFGLNKGMESLSNNLTTLPDRIRAFAAANPMMTKSIIIIVGLIAVLAPLAIAIGAVAFAVSGLAIAFGFLSLPVLLIIAAVGLLITAGVMLYKNWDGVVGGATLLWGDFKDFMIDGLKSIYNGIIDFLIFPMKMAAKAMSALGFEGFENKLIEFEKKISFDVSDKKLGIDANSSTKSQADVNINLNAPKGVVASTTAVKKGSPMNLGLSMGASL